jgi:homoserine dehydrogenase
MSSDPHTAGDPPKTVSPHLATAASASSAVALDVEGTRAGTASTPTRPFRVGLLGYGTVGSAFATLLKGREAGVGLLTGQRPVLTDVLTTTKGSFSEILARSDAIVELIGGIEPAREYVLAALAAGKHVITANKQLISQHGEELFEAARAGGAQLRFEAAVAGVVPVIRVLTESLAGAHVERVHGIVNGTTNFILSEMAHGSSYEHALAEAQRQGYAEADPSDDVSGRDAAAKMAILARLAFGTPVHIDQVPYEGIEQLQTDDLQYARELGLGLKLIGTAERRDGGLSVRVHPAFLYSGHPLASVGGPFNAVTVESEEITEITMSGPGAGGPQTASAVLGDLISTMLPPSVPTPPLHPLPLVEDVRSGFYIHMEVADRPGTLATIAHELGEQGASIKSVVQHGLGEHARLVMVIHPLPESRLREALRRIGALDFLRSTPRAIRVIEEEFM